MHKSVYLTAAGLAKLQAELEYLITVRRVEVTTHIQETRESGDPTDNPEYEGAKEEQAFLEGRILTLEAMIRNAQVIDEDQDSAAVALGASVTVVDEAEGGGAETYTIVGPAETNPAQGRIPNESPVGRALLGHGVGAVIRVTVPAGERRLRIIGLNGLGPVGA